MSRPYITCALLKVEWYTEFHFINCSSVISGTIFRCSEMILHEIINFILFIYEKLKNLFLLQVHCKRPYGENYFKKLCSIENVFILKRTRIANFWNYLFIIQFGQFLKIRNASLISQFYFDFFLLNINFYKTYISIHDFIHKLEKYEQRLFYFLSN